MIRYSDDKAVVARTTKVDEWAKCCYEGILYEDQCEENNGHVYAFENNRK